MIWRDLFIINDVNSSESSSSSDHESDAREDSSSPTTTKRVKRKYNRKRSIKIVKKFKSEKKDVPCMFGEYVASEIRTIGSEFYSSRAKECIAAILSRAKTGRLGSHLLAVLSDFEEPLLPLPLLPPENESSEPGPSPIPMDNDEETAKEDRNSSDSESNDITGWLRAPSD